MTINMVVLKRFFIFIFVVFSLAGFTQTETIVERSNIIEKTSGKKYYLHSVAKGNTLFSIAKAYDVEVSDIIIENPDCLDGINLGQVLRIPHRFKSDIVYPFYHNNYLLHQTAKGETFYSISKKYDVSVKNLTDLNGDNLGVGQIIRINKDSIKTKPTIFTFNKDSIPVELADVEKQKLLNEKGVLVHKVKVGNTLFAIARLYGVGADEIIALNPTVNKGIKPGQLLEIPFKNHAIIDGVDKKKFKKEIKDTLDKALKNTYNIAVLLPFSLGNDSSFNALSLFDEKGNLDAKAMVAVEFYAGVQIALDSLNKLGIKAKVFVYDTDRSAVKVQQIIDRSEFLEMDFIIGPLYSSYFNLVGDFAKKHKIGIVAPMSKSSVILNDNIWVNKFVTATSAEVKAMANYIKQNYKDANLLVVSDNDANTQTVSEMFYKQLYFADSTASKRVKQVTYTNSASIKEHLADGKANVVFFPTTNAATVSKVLNDLSYRHEKIVLIGDEKWQGYNLPIEQLKKMNVHLLGSSKIDYTNEDVKIFLTNYRAKFNAEPTEFSFSGYDVTMAHINWLYLKGVGFGAKLDKRDYKGLQNDIVYRRAIKSNGFENQAAIVLKFENLEYIKVK